MERLEQYSGFVEMVIVAPGYANGAVTMAGTDSGNRRLD